jgi:hypothetical protein
MDFEVYVPRGEKEQKLPVVSFSKSSIVLNNVARQRLGTDRVELAFNRATNTVRIRAVEDGGMQIKKTKVFGKGFFKHFNISPRGKYVAEYNDRERALYVRI